MQGIMLSYTLFKGGAGYGVYKLLHNLQDEYKY
jgi:hypothetical protein